MLPTLSYHMTSLVAWRDSSHLSLSPKLISMTVTKSAVMEALGRVIDPEIRRPLTELNMIDDIEISGSEVTVKVLLTTAGCPLRDTITSDITDEVGSVEGVSAVHVAMGVMSDDQKRELREKLTGHVEREIPFTRPDSLTRVIAVTSGKGGVGKSSVTANLAVALAHQGLKVGVLDADIYGFSLPRMLGITHEPQSIDGMIVPPVGAGGVKVISIGMFVPEGQPIIWRGPMLHRALQQFLADVFWGDLDILLIDMPPGTGDVAISIAQLLPNAEILIVTTPQIAAAEVAQRSGSIAIQTHQRVMGVVENMAYLPQPDGSALEIFGSGGGKTVSSHLGSLLDYEVPLLAQIPLDIDLRIGGDTGVPIASEITSEEVPGASPARAELQALAKKVATHARGLAGRPLGVAPVRH